MANGGQLLTVEEYAEKFFLKFLKVCLSLYFFTGGGARALWGSGIGCRDSLSACAVEACH